MMDDLIHNPDALPFVLGIAMLLAAATSILILALAWRIFKGSKESPPQPKSPLKPHQREYLEANL